MVAPVTDAPRQCKCKVNLFALFSVVLEDFISFLHVSDVANVATIRFCVESAIGNKILVNIRLHNLLRMIPVSTIFADVLAIRLLKGASGRPPKAHSR